jgi:hypothetical protein
MNIGVTPRPEDCIVPPGALVVHVKVCETCGFPFVTERDKNCRRCHANPEPLGRDLTLEILEDLMRTEHPLPL